RQLQRVLVANVDVGEDPLFAMLDDPLPLHVVPQPFSFEQVRDSLHAIAEDVDIDIRTVPDMPGQHAADQAGTIPRQQPHDRERKDAHLAQLVEPLFPFKEPRQRLNFVPNLGIARQIGRLDPTLAEAAGSFLLRAEILRFLALIHQTGGFDGNLPPQFRSRHRLRRFVLSPCGALGCESYETHKKSSSAQSYVAPGEETSSLSLQLVPRELWAYNGR